MRKQILVKLTSDLSDGNTLVLPQKVDAFRFSDVGHIAIVGQARYKSPTDFTLAIDGDGDVTVTWETTTIPSGSDIRFGVALDDTHVSGTGDSALAAAVGTRPNNLPISDTEQWRSAANGWNAYPLDANGGADTVAGAADAGNQWLVRGWFASQSADAVLTISDVDYDAPADMAIDVFKSIQPVEGQIAPVQIAEAQPLIFTVSAGRMRGHVYAKQVPVVA